MIEKALNQESDFSIQSESKKQKKYGFIIVDIYRLTNNQWYATIIRDNNFGKEENVKFMFDEIDLPEGDYKISNADMDYEYWIHPKTAIIQFVYRDIENHYIKLANVDLHELIETKLNEV